MTASLGLMAVAASSPAAVSISPSDLYTALLQTPIDPALLPAGTPAPKVAAEPPSSSAALGTVELTFGRVQSAGFVVYPTAAAALSAFRATATAADGPAPGGVPSPARTFVFQVKEPTAGGGSTSQAIGLVTGVQANVVVTASAQASTGALGISQATRLAQLAFKHLASVESQAVSAATPPAGETTTTQTAPPAAGQSPLAAAVQQTRKASFHFTLRMQFASGARSLVLVATGTENSRLHQLAMRMDMRKFQPSLGTIQVAEVGPNVYLHFPSLNDARARAAGIRPWVQTNLKQAAGYDPWAITGLRLLGSSLDFMPAGIGSDAGLPVHRYLGVLDLKSAEALNPAVAQTLKNLGPAAKAIENMPIGAGFDVGTDGYVRRFGETFTLTVGAPLTVDIQMTTSGFNSTITPVKAPPASQVMSMSRLEKLAGIRTLPTI